MGRPTKHQTASAKKRAVKAKKEKYKLSQINMGFEAAQRWRQVLTSSVFHTDAEFAKHLLDRYASDAMASTPLTLKKNTDYDKLSGISPIDDASSCQSAEKALQGRVIPEAEQENGVHTGVISAEESHDSDPFGIQLQLTDPKDMSYKPSEDSITEYQDEKTINTKTYHMEVEVDNMEECDDLELVHDFDEINEQETEGQETEQEESSSQVLDDSATALIGTPFIGYTSCLLELATAKVDDKCPTCKTTVSISTKVIGTCINLKWMCKKNHVCHTWSSQPRLTARGNYLGDVMLALNVLLSGNNYTKIALLMKFVGFKPMSQYKFFQLQSHLALPAIREFWSDTQDEIFQKLKEKELVLAGDGRNDSPGHSSQYCSYTLMDTITQDILSTVVVDKRQVGLKSPNMEAYGLKKALKELQDREMKVIELVTDAHSQIPPILRALSIEHQWDVWHGAKNFARKLLAAAAVKGCEALQTWVKDIVTHFWFCAENANGDPLRFKSLMRGVLQHVRNVHSWDSGDGVGIAGCLHEPILEEDPKKPWLVPGSPPHKALQKIIYDGTWLKTAGEKYKNFRHTGELEVFHHHILMYASKRFAYSPPVYTARVLLAALDHQHHKGRPYKRDKNGEIKYRRIFNKRSSVWSPVPMKVSKKYGYIKMLQRRAIERLLQDNSILRKKVPMAEDDPRTISSTIASVQPKDLSTLLAEHRSRKGNRVSGANNN